MNKLTQIGVVIIGRNEGERLVRCLKSVDQGVGHVVYVDSDSIDESVKKAHNAGADVIMLDMAQPFTAARARNMGFERVISKDNPSYVQFVDGDCELKEGWLVTAKKFLDNNPKAAAVFGKLIEKNPEASVYNRLCDNEWDGIPGSVSACGGIAMFRVSAMIEVDGFDPRLIAGEEPELCVRLRALNWQIWRIDDPMAVHDAEILRFSQWWKRARRGGHAYAEGAALHGALPEQHYVAQVRRALVWGLVLPVAILTLSIGNVWAFMMLLAYPLQVIRLAVRDGIWARESWENAFFLTLSKFPETVGILTYWWGRFKGKQVKLIEYK